MDDYTKMLQALSKVAADHRRKYAPLVEQIAQTMDTYQRKYAPAFQIAALAAEQFQKQYVAQPRQGAFEMSIAARTAIREFTETPRVQQARAMAQAAFAQFQVLDTDIAECSKALAAMSRELKYRLHTTSLAPAVQQALESPRAHLEVAATSASAERIRDTFVQVASYLAPGSPGRVAWEEALQRSASVVADLSALGQASLASARLDSIGGLIGARTLTQDRLHKHVIATSRSYADLLTSFQRAENSVLTMRPALPELAATEHFTSARVIRTISPTIEETVDKRLEQADHQTAETVLHANRSSLPALLVTLDSSFVTMWEGAWEALDSRRKDHPRQAMASLRELFRHILHLLAPDKHVREFTQEERHYHEGRPTRQARVLYICNRLSSGTMAKYINTKARQTLDLMDIFHKIVHQKSSPVTQSQLKALLIEADALLVFLLEAAGGDDP